MPVSLTEKQTSWPFSSSSRTRAFTTISPLLGELDGVIAEVDQDLPQSQGVAFEVSGDRSVDIENQFEALGGGLFGDQIANVLQYLFEIEVDIFDRQFARLDLREIQNVVDNAQQVLARLLNLANVLSLTRIEVGLQAPDETCR